MKLIFKKPTLMLSLCITTFLLSCDKEEAGPAPSISTISASSGAKGSEITIIGKGFSTDVNKYTVSFNGVNAEVTSATTTEIVVVVPHKAKDGAILVSFEGKTITGPVFDYQETYTVSTIAGNGVSGYANENGVNASFHQVKGITIDATGNLFVADAGNNRIRKITPAGDVSTYAGNGSMGFQDGDLSTATFSTPSDVVFDSSGNMYVLEAGNNKIRKISTGGLVTTVAGSGGNGYEDGVGTSAKFNYPLGFAIDAADNIYVADSENNRIRKVTPAGVVSTLAGQAIFGFNDGVGASAQFRTPSSILVHENGDLYVGDLNNHRIRKVTPEGVVSTVTGVAAGDSDGDLATARYRGPSGMVKDSDGNIFVADYANNRIRKITPTGMVSTIAGTSAMGYEDGDGATAAFNGPVDIIIDKNGDLYITDSKNYRIRKITIE